MLFRDILQLLAKDNLQVQALSECYEMADLCHKMVTVSVESLRNCDDASIDIDIYQLDKRLNSFERDVRRKVMTHLSLGHTSDIASGLVLVSIVIDLERIGDYSKNIHDLAEHHPTRLRGGELEGSLKTIESETLDLFGRTISAFKSGNINQARRVMTDYKEDISGQSSEVLKALVRGDVVMETRDASALALYVRFLKRIAAHSRNLCSSLVNPFDRIGYQE